MERQNNLTKTPEAVPQGAVYVWKSRWLAPNEWPKYEDVCTMDNDAFVAFLTSFLAPAEAMEDEERGRRLGRSMETSEMAYGYLSGLLSHIILKKRILSRNGDKQGHEDMVDAEKCVNAILKAVDMRYKGDSKQLTAYLDERWESRQTPNG